MVILLQIAKLAKNSLRANIVLNKKVCCQSLTERNFRGKKQHFIPQNLVVYWTAHSYYSFNNGINLKLLAAVLETQTNF